MSWTTLVGAGALVVRGHSLLMVLQRRPYGVHWEIPSGYYDANESLEEAAAREALEETGIAVRVESLVCTLTWERAHDRRRNVLAFFAARPLKETAEPHPQAEEGIEDARFVDPLTLGGIHPLEQPILDRWWTARETGFHLHVDVMVDEDGSQSYVPLG